MGCLVVIVLFLAGMIAGHHWGGNLYLVSDATWADRILFGIGGIMFGRIIMVLELIMKESSKEAKK